MLPPTTLGQQAPSSSTSTKRPRDNSMPADSDPPTKKSRSESPHATTPADTEVASAHSTLDKGKQRMTSDIHITTTSPMATSTAVTNAKLVEDLESELSCGCCAGLVYRPMILQPCQHFFCGSCLKLWVQNSKSNSCPECRSSSTHATASRTIQSIVDLLVRNRPDLQRTENERQQADDICPPCNEIKMPQPKPPNPDVLLPQSRAHDPAADNFARPCPHCLPHNQFGWRCPRPIADPQADPDNAWNLDDGPPPGHGFCGACSELHALVSPGSSACSLCHTSYCGLSIPHLCVAPGVRSSRLPHSLSTITGILEAHSESIWEAMEYNEVEIDILFDWLRERPGGIRSVYSEMVEHIRASYDGFDRLIETGIFSTDQNNTNPLPVVSLPALPSFPNISNITSTSSHPFNNLASPFSSESGIVSSPGFSAILNGPGSGPASLQSLRQSFLSTDMNVPLRTSLTSHVSGDAPSAIEIPLLPSVGSTAASASINPTISLSTPMRVSLQDLRMLLSIGDTSDGVPNAGREGSIAQQISTTMHASFADRNTVGEPVVRPLTSEVTSHPSSSILPAIVPSSPAGHSAPSPRGIPHQVVARASPPVSRVCRECALEIFLSELYPWWARERARILVSQRTVDNTNSTTTREQSVPNAQIYNTVPGPPPNPQQRRVVDGEHDSDDSDDEYTTGGANITHRAVGDSSTFAGSRPQQLPEWVGSRADCRDGRRCERQRDVVHSKEYNHIIAPITTTTMPNAEPLTTYVATAQTAGATTAASSITSLAAVDTLVTASSQLSEGDSESERAAVAQQMEIDTDDAVSNADTVMQENEPSGELSPPVVEAEHPLYPDETSSPSSHSRSASASSQPFGPVITPSMTSDTTPYRIQPPATPNEVLMDMTLIRTGSNLNSDEPASLGTGTNSSYRAPSAEIVMNV